MPAAAPMAQGPRQALIERARLAGLSKAEAMEGLALPQTRGQSVEDVFGEPDRVAVLDTMDEEGKR